MATKKKSGFNIFGEDMSVKKEAKISTEVRATFQVEIELLEKMRALAYWDRVLLKDILNKALADHFTAYEKKNGPIKIAPNKD